MEIRAFTLFFFFLYKTCKFSQLFDFESRAQTRPNNPFTLRLADVRDPRYFLGLQLKIFLN